MNRAAANCAVSEKQPVWTGDIFLGFQKEHVLAICIVDSTLLWVTALLRVKTSEVFRALGRFFEYCIRKSDAHRAISFLVANDKAEGRGTLGVTSSYVRFHFVSNIKNMTYEDVTPFSLSWDKKWRVGTRPACYKTFFKIIKTIDPGHRLLQAVQKCPDARRPFLGVPILWAAKNGYKKNF